MNYHKNKLSLKKSGELEVFSTGYSNIHDGPNPKRLTLQLTEGTLLDGIKGSINLYFTKEEAERIVNSFTQSLNEHF